MYSLTKVRKKAMSLIKKKPSAKEELRTSKREMSVATRGVEREIGSLQLEEKKLVAEIKRTAKTGNEANNSVVRTWGECRPKGKSINHVDLVNKLQFADFVRGTKVAGGRGYFLKGTGVLLNKALILFGKEFLMRRNYELLKPPSIMKKEVMTECAQLSQFDEELYKVVDDGGDGDEKGDANEKYLIATSEQPLCAYHMNEHIYPQSLPMRYVGVSHCFRKEAGSHGRDTHGLFRTHQFEKVEQFCITSPNDNKSWEMHEEMLKNAEDFYKELGLPYRVVNIVSGALNDAAAKKYDLEAWFPASETFRELVSCSNCTDSQARNLGIAYGLKKNDEQTKQFVHLLNCTLTATGRTICCILENYQKEDGVVVPEVLRRYMKPSIDFIPFKN